MVEKKLRQAQKKNSNQLKKKESRKLQEKPLTSNSTFDCPNIFVNYFKGGNPLLSWSFFHRIIITIHEQLKYQRRMEG